MPTKRNSRASGNGSRSKDAISLLKEDHKVMQDLLNKLVGSASRATKSRESIFEKVEQELKAHSLIEDEIFYPAFKDAMRKKDDKQLFFEAKEEHHMVDVVLSEIKEPQDNETFAAKCKVLNDLVNHHIEEEEKEMFPLAKKSIESDMLKELASQMEERKEEIRSELTS